MSGADSIFLEALERARQGVEPAGTIEEALANASLVVRDRAAEVAAEKLTPERLVEFVASSESYTRRATAMEALRKAAPRSLPAVIAGALGRSRDTALFCIQVLGGIDHPQARSTLRSLVSHPDVLLAQAAIEAIGEQRDAEAVPLLLQLLSRDPKELEGDSWRAVSAVITLGRIGRGDTLEALLRLRDIELFREAVDEAVRAIRMRSGAEA